MKFSGKVVLLGKKQIEGCKKPVQKTSGSKNFSGAHVKVGTLTRWHRDLCLWVLELVFQM
jgi:hypothetical protein